MGMVTGGYVAVPFEFSPCTLIVWHRGPPFIILILLFVTYKLAQIHKAGCWHKQAAYLFFLFFSSALVAAYKFMGLVKGTAVHLQTLSSYRLIFHVYIMLMVYASHSKRSVRKLETGYTVRIYLKKPKTDIMFYHSGVRTDQAIVNMFYYFKLGIV